MRDKDIRRVLMIRERFIVKGGIYHITQRAPGREQLFLEHDDYLTFIALLKRCSKEFNIDIFAFSLLPNHLHILLRINEENLSKAMKTLFEKYARYFNNKYQRKGHVFCGRFRAALCNDENYLLTISVYIHLNSYKARLVKSPFKYRWHSLDVYVKNLRSSFIKADMVLGLLDPDTAKAKEKYRGIITSGVSLKYKNILEEPEAVKKFHRVFIPWFKDKFLDKERDGRKSELFKDFLDIERELGNYKSRRRMANPKDRKACQYLIQQLLSRGYTREEISRRINISRTTAYRLLNETF